MRRVPKNDWRALVCSDLHLDATTAGFPRFADIERNVQRAVNRAKELRATFIFLGDLCDPDSVSAHRCVERAARWAQELSDEGLRSVWVAGNHDVVEDGSGATTLSPLRGAFGDERLVTVVESPKSIDLGEVRLACLPYPSRARAYDPHEALVEMVGDYDGPLLVAAHLQVDGAEMASETYDMPRGRDVAFPWLYASDEARPNTLLMNGHYHRPQEIERLGTTLLIPGAPERLRFDEIDHEPSFLVVEYGPDGYKWKRMPFEARPMYAVLEDHGYWKGEILPHKINASMDMVPEGGLIRVRAPAGVNEALVENLRKIYAPYAAAFSVSVARETKQKTQEVARRLPRADESPRSVALALAREHEQGGAPLVALVADILDTVGVP